ncbi:Hypothetical predicted protein [Pelobates cultripes]|nr:Hypothetical predicted protein [Pelobates cultripes]
MPEVPGDFRSADQTWTQHSRYNGVYPMHCHSNLPLGLQEIFGAYCVSIYSTIHQPYLAKESSSEQPRSKQKGNQ